LLFFLTDRAAGAVPDKELRAERPEAGQTEHAENEDRVL